MKIRARFVTPISFWEKASSYVAGQGNSTAWVLYSEGTMTTFPCEWRGKILAGKNQNEVFDGDAEGALERAVIRMPFIPALFDKLRSGAMVAERGVIPEGQTEPNLTSQNVYEVFGTVDNILEENQYMEFQLARYEAK
jgi:hypothetical protein